MLIKLSGQSRRNFKVAVKSAISAAGLLAIVTPSFAQYDPGVDALVTFHNVGNCTMSAQGFTEEGNHIAEHDSQVGGYIPAWTSTVPDPSYVSYAGIAGALDCRGRGWRHSGMRTGCFRLLPSGVVCCLYLGCFGRREWTRVRPGGRQQRRRRHGSTRLRRMLRWRWQRWTRPTGTRWGRPISDFFGFWRWSNTAWNRHASLARFGTLLIGLVA